MDRWLTHAPMVLMYKGKILHQNLSKTNNGEDDLLAKLHEANALNFSEVHAVILESTGDMSVLHSSENIELNDKLLQGGEGIPK